MIQLWTSRCLSADDARPWTSATRRSVCALGLTLAVTTPVLAAAQSTGAGPRTQSILSKEPTVTQLNTAAPAQPRRSSAAEKSLPAAGATPSPGK